MLIRTKNFFLWIENLPGKKNKRKIQNYFNPELFRK